MPRQQGHRFHGIGAVFAQRQLVSQLLMDGDDLHEKLCVALQGVEFALTLALALALSGRILAELEVF